MKPLKLFSLFALVLLLGSGCDKSSPKATDRAIPYSLASQTIAHLHWVGKNHLATDTNAAGLMRIWNQPESTALEAQTLDKLSTAPWRLLPHVATTNYAAGAPLLRALLDDCVQRESYLEIHAATNQPGEVAFAIRLPADRTALWQNSLGAVLESLTGIRPEPTDKGWTLTKHDLPNRIELTCIGEWVVVGIGQGQNALFGDFVGRVLRNKTAVNNEFSSSWVDAGIDLLRVADAFKLEWELPLNIATLSMQTSGDGQSLNTRAQIGFSQPLGLILEPWNVPTNLVQGQIASFTALRGFGPWLGTQKVWDELKLGSPPNQLFIWAGAGVPMQTLFAIPALEATNRLAQVTDSLMQKVNPWLETNRSGRLELPEAFQGITWVGMPFLAPYIRAKEDFVYGGFFPPPFGRNGIPAPLLLELNRSNTVYYDWEITSPRIESWFYIGQTLRIVLHRPQLPASPALTWLQANTNTLGPCVTVAVQSGAEQLNILRRSAGLGLTAFELHLLADWITSPDFPRGLNTLVSTSENFEKRARPAASSTGTPTSNP